MSGKNFFLGMGLLVFATACYSTSKDHGLAATAEIMDGKGEKIGTAEFTQTSDSVEIFVNVWGLTQGTHAIHLHTFGECHGPDFQSAKGHFNPYNKKHGLKNADGPHAGDLENFEVDSSGKARFTRIAKLVTLGPGVNTLFPEGGTCIVIHEKADDNVTDPAGNAGARLACGKIVLKATN